jgi:aminopeptidase N
VFWQAVQDYLQKFQNSVVETNDFRSVLEQHSGRSLQKFFDQWFFGAGYPDIKVAFSYDKKQKKGTFEITQKQVSKNGPVFELKTDLGWTFEKGKGELEHLAAIVIEKERQSFSFVMDQEPTQVRFDPLCKVLHKLEFEPSEAMSIEQLHFANDVIGRIQAAQNLGKTGKNKNLASLADRYKTEVFWGVKREIIKSLADAQTEKSIEILLSLLDQESDHLVLDRLLSALGQYRDERVKMALSEYLEKSHLPPKAWSQAVLALGGQRDPKSIPQIKVEFQKDESPQKQVARACLQALGATRSADVVPYLKDQIKPDALGYRIRKAAVLGLSQLTPYVDRYLVSAMEENVADLLRDQDKWVREAAVQGISIGRMTSALKRVKDYGARLPLQERLAVDKVVSHLSAEDPGGRHGALEKQLEELKASYRKLEARIQDLEDKK